MTSKVKKLEPRTAPARLDTPTDLSSDAVREVSAALNALVADTFALYVKTKNFHWHVSGPHFRDYHLLLDEQADQLQASIDILAERARKVGGTTIRSIGHIAKLQRVKDNDKSYVPGFSPAADGRALVPAIAFSRTGSPGQTAAGHRNLCSPPASNRRPMLRLQS